MTGNVFCLLATGKDAMCQARCSHEASGGLTVQHIMAEPIVQELMRADHVDPAAFEALLSSVAAWPPDHAAQSGLRHSRVEWFRSVKSWATKAKLAHHRRERE
jgi:hypothetical protein